MALVRWVGRAIGLDVHRDFCVIAICEDGVVRSAGRVPSTPEGLAVLAESLLPSDRVALEVTGSCWEVARLLEPHVNRAHGSLPPDPPPASPATPPASRRSDPSPTRCPASSVSSKKINVPVMTHDKNTSAADSDGVLPADQGEAAVWAARGRTRL